MKKKEAAIIISSKRAARLAFKIKQELPGMELYTLGTHPQTQSAHPIHSFTATEFDTYKYLIFIGALGICVRTIAPLLHSKTTDPAVINIDSTGRFAISVLSGHIGGANEYTRMIADIIGAENIITTQSDNTDTWPLDILGRELDWIKDNEKGTLNRMIADFIEGKPTALLLDIRDRGTRYLEHTKPSNVDIYYHHADIDQSRYKLLILVTPYIYDTSIPTLYYRPAVLHLGVGCRKDCDPADVIRNIKNDLQQARLSWLSIKNVSTIDLKKDEPLVRELAEELDHTIQKLGPGREENNVAAPPEIYTAADLQGIQVPNPSDKVFEVTSVYGVAEACALKSSGNTRLLIEKQKRQHTPGNEYTYAVALNRQAERSGFIEIVGAGPGDPELISVRGKRFLEEADLILYAGSLVPVELTRYAKPGATVRSSASMTLEEQFALMKEFYDKGLFVVRLHTGDPCIYGAIQEQMAFFDEYGMKYHITPGISSFQAAAAALQSQFTIPEKVQTIILTRGEGRTPMPEKEKLHLLARSQSTMCIFLSASIVDEVQSELMQHYPPTTPVAACYHLTWPDERVYRGELQHLAEIVKSNNLTLTTMIVVGEAIDNREGQSKLYSDQFKHLFRN